MKIIRKVSIVICFLLFAMSSLLLGLNKLDVIKQNNGGAITNTDTTSYAKVDEIWDGNKMNKTNFDKLLAIISDSSFISSSNLEPLKNLLSQRAISASDIRNAKTGKAEGQDVVVRFAGLDWQVMYLSNDINDNPTLTLWLNGSYQDSWSGRNGKLGEYYRFVNGSLYSSFSAGWASTNTSVEYPSNMYGTSYVRAVTLNNGGEYSTSSTSLYTANQSSTNPFAKFTMSGVSGSVTKYLTTPSQMSWQATLPTSIINQLGNIGGGRYSNEVCSDTESSANFTSRASNYAGKTGNSAWKNDYVWLPSGMEIGYYSNDCYDLGYFYYMFDGLWGTSGAQRKDSIDSSGLSYMARSGNNKGNATKTLAHRSRGILCGNKDVRDYLPIRPAIHLNLNMTEDILYNFLFDYNGGEEGLGEQNGVKKGDIFTFPQTTKAGYTLIGWEHNGTIYKATNGKLELVVPNLGNANSAKVFTAVWEANKYKVVLDNQDASSSGSTSVDIVYSTIPPDITPPEKTGFDFKGYFTQTNGRGVQYYNDNGEGISAWQETNVFTLYAKWIATKYHIIYDANGGQGEMANTEFYYLNSVQLPSCTFTHTSKLFIGWKDQEGNTYKNNYTIPAKRYTENITLTAQWQTTWADYASEELKEGCGTQTDPYLIKTAEDLAFLSLKVQEENIKDEEHKYIDAFYKQTAHIDLSSHYWLSIGGNTMEVNLAEESQKAFRGVYDGQKYSISGINFYSQTSASGVQLFSNVGLFGYTIGAEIRNINLSAGDVVGNSHIGGLVGYAYTGLIENCISYANVNGNQCCGMIGESFDITLKQCFNHGNITGKRGVGGLVGRILGNTSSSIINCIAQCNVKGSSSIHTAGLVGYVATNADISNSAFIGTVSNGYILTAATNNASIVDCYADGSSNLGLSANTSAVKSTIYITGENKYYYQGENNFANWTMYNGKPLPAGLTWIGGIILCNEEFSLDGFTKIE